MPNGLLLDHCIDPDGGVNAEILARALGVDVLDLRRAAPNQRRLKELYCILSVIRPWTRSASDSWSWYHGRRLAGLDGRTPAAMVNEGRYSELKEFLESGEALATAWPAAMEIDFVPKDARPAANS
ncbi:hypothetical protein [Limimaricola pyoseonensis]|uniref:Antitoxin Xre/MbcA/ParS-like toxin-binding domain-containing protein n=1 Tax=Limimaricola pyoseonensis TaxID=521013 RepID=A0A1G7IKX7_9RHOB|nr:hypothetical protein [Limimaricola pyoseonensis]SDF13218.1 hypothetical protein SAMN04488567_3504 [Limimaricola pyoseonensis]